ncbi:hypothetical protein ACFYUD_04260 [Nocardia tengchongensis]|uniref:hypothetical protein n=1 Tax=Nocardia tengchongensis TaxID=2055889 RepID=UPI0036AE490B
MVNFDTGLMRGLASDHRTRADAIKAITPVGAPELEHVRPRMEKSVFATRIEETLQAMDTVAELHATRMRTFADLTDAAAAAADQMDDDNAVTFGG